MVFRENVPASDFFPDVEVNYRYEQDFGYIRIKPDETLIPGDGYWVLMPEVRTVVLWGECILEYTLSVGNGWHMIGSCSTPARAFLNTGSIGIIYRFDPDSGYQRLLLQR
jgi:hypothetical protein